MSHPGKGKAAAPCGPVAPTAKQRFDRGLDAMLSLGQDHPLRLLSEVSEIAPDFAAYVVEYAYGDISSRPGLSLKQREFAAVAALAAIGGPTSQLKEQLAGALTLGWTRGELVELMMQISVIAGFPAALNGLAALKQVIDEGMAD